ncbi:ribosome hibernation-promoting factor, HPF/YfiA family [Gimibacter soli]|uniref:Ribosome hibernation promoting factor n=1 Tax=Gimibacter soli TaxID=3024400 RepID=A0AAE9XQT2_9PROT|nr:ribosome-associated translation inhibitor RaiA [Gimibacter soli]WCL54517.1 ribosome-associated translation inhibitor RaiA [Gimibacter soli]
MDINVTGRKMNVGEALTTHVTDRLQAITEKYFTRSIDASATFHKEGHLTRADISLHANQGINMQARAETDDPYAAFELAADKIEKQLRRYKRRLKNHHAMTGHEEMMFEPVRSTVLAPHADEEGEAVNGADHHPVIIAEANVEIPRVTVSDAVMLMDLSDSNAFMFRNTKSDTLDVVYRRGDGNIGWISPGARD